MQLLARPWVPDGLLSSGCILITLGMRVQVMDSTGIHLRVNGGEVLLLGLSAIVLLFWRRAPVAVLVALLAIDWVFRALDIGSQVVFTGAALAMIVASPSSRHKRYGVTIFSFAIILLSVPVIGRSFTGLVTCLITLTAGLLSGWVVQYFRHLSTLEREQRALVAELKSRQALLQVEEDRAQMRREIHDVLASSLTLIVRLADSAVVRSRSGSRRENGELLEKIAELGREASADARNIMAAHVSEGSGRNGNLELLVDRFRQAGLPVQFVSPELGAVVPPRIAHEVYRIFGEALTNTLRYADQPTVVYCQLEIDSHSNMINIEVADDGYPKKVKAVSGSGLHGIRERAARCGGHADIGPRPVRSDGRSGWRVRVELPLLGVVSEREEDLTP